MSKVTITTAVKLSATQLKKLTTAIEKKYGKVSAVETLVDKTILGGVIVTIGSRQFDNSYRGRIQAFKQQIVTAISE
jgi:F-type H+-transporting ATPase subunit delta